MNPTVLIYRSELLPPSETFVSAQGHALRGFTPRFAGLRLVPAGLALDPCEIDILTHGNNLGAKLRRRLFLKTGIAPHFIRTLKLQHPVLLHAHFAVDGAIALPLQEQLDIPMLVTLHGYDVTSNDETLGSTVQGRIFLRRRSELFARAHTFICVSDFIRRQALARGFPEAKLRTLPIGVDLSFFAPDPLRSRDLDPTVLFVGRLVEEKGCDHLISAMSLLQERHPEAKLLIVGDGPLLDTLRSQARISLHQCTFLGFQPPAVVRDLMYRATVLVAPSILTARGNSEGLGLVACEAQAIGLPVAGFHGTGIDEAVADGETGILVPTRDDMALAEAISCLLSDASISARLSAAGPGRAKTLFSLEAQTAKLEKLYLEILDQHPCPRNLSVAALSG